MGFLEKFRTENSGLISNGVYFLSESPTGDSFEDLYIKLRTAEGRLYDDQTVRLLPEINKIHVHYEEWMIRKNSTGKLTKYLSGMGREMSILDFGCGNGWMANRLSEIAKTEVFGIDINVQELEQAARVFGKKGNLVFVFADLFKSKISEIKFDIIVLASVLMYFPDMKALIDKLLSMLNPNGEIHIIDNALYDEKNIAEARRNTLKHYEKLGLPEADNIIHHQLMSELDIYNPEILYNPKAIANRVSRKVSKPELSPFYWMKILK